MAEPEIFHIHSMVRDVTNRAQRAAAPGRQRFKQYLGGGQLRLIRKRPTPVAKPLLMKLRAELIELEKKGILKVTLPNGQRIDLESLAPVEPAPAAPKKAAPKLDSAEDDKTFPGGVGESREQVEGGVPATAELDTPAAMKEIPEGVEPPEGPSVMDDDEPAQKKTKKRTARKSSRGR